MSTDRELLELAARAINKDLSKAKFTCGFFSIPLDYDEVEAWNPSECEADAARLAMQLCAAGKMRIQITEQSITCFYEQDGVFVPWSWGYETCTLSEAFCKCITGAAAEIGRNMP